MEYTVFQDGADFYLKNSSTLVAVVTYPDGVKDFSLIEAEAARLWFINQSKRWGWTISFPNPFI